MNISNKENKSFFPSYPSGEIVMGEKVNELPPGQLVTYAKQVSNKLEEFPHKMLQLTPEELVNEMNQAKTILCLDQKQDLLAFGRIWYYGVNEVKQILYEFGSWICFAGNGYGRQVLEAGRDLSATQFPYARLIAVVESSNLKAQNVITELGGAKVGYKESEVIKNESGKPAFMHIYDITRRQQPLEVVKQDERGLWTWKKNAAHIF